MRPDDYSDIFRDRQGRPCGMERWVEIAGDESLRHIGADIVPSSRGPLYVSTIWTGVDMGLWSRRSLIFETMTFAGDDVVDEYCARYATLLEATVYHHLICGQAAQSWWTNLGGLA